MKIDIISIFDGSIWILGYDKISFFIIMMSIFVLVIVSLYKRNNSIRSIIGRQPGIIRYTIYAIIMVLLVFYWVDGQAMSNSSFIYFQF